MQQPNKEEFRPKKDFFKFQMQQIFSLNEMNSMTKVIIFYILMKKEGQFENPYQSTTQNATNFQL